RLGLLGLIRPVGDCEAVANQGGVEVAAVESAQGELAAVAVGAGGAAAQGASAQPGDHLRPRLTTAGIGLPLAHADLMQLRRVDALEPDLMVSKLVVLEPQRIPVDHINGASVDGAAAEVVEGAEGKARQKDRNSQETRERKARAGEIARVIRAPAPHG